MKESVGERVKALRVARGWSQAQLAKASGVSQPAIKKIEGGQTVKSRFLPDIARALGCDLAEIEGLQQRAVNRGTTTTGRTVQRSAFATLLGDADLAVFSSTEAGGGAIILSSEPIDYVRRPAPLQNVKDGYGIIVTGDSMLPEFRPGDTALVHPHLPPIAGEACVFYSEDAGATVKATIKIFNRASESHWHVEQWNPPKKFTLSRSEWQKCHRVVGKYSRR
ncbi:MAG TPA: LexA family transcriptional regulator [Pseudolabrys sp.]|nr:LexA family transcriptional regulator [Pseudolabrys sp.]